MRRALALIAALIAGLQTLFGAAMTAAAALGVLAGVAFGSVMCTGGQGCENPSALFATGVLVVVGVALLLVVAPGVIAVGLVRNRRWAAPAGIVVELATAGGAGLWLALQKPPLPDYYVLGIPAVALLAAALMAALLASRSGTETPPQQTE
jgi:hypothetical protein